MKKHLIVHGDRLSGKSLFIDNFIYKSSAIIGQICEPSDIFENIFLFDFGDKIPDLIIFNDVNIKVPPEAFLEFSIYII